MQTEQTEIDLLMLAITDVSKTQVAFAKMLDITTQGLNKLIRKAKNNDGKLNPKFVRKLKTLYNIDIYQYVKREPTLDFHSAKELESMNKIITGAEPEQPYITKKMLNHLLDENQDLRNRLKDCEQELASLKNKKNRSA